MAECTAVQDGSKCCPCQKRSTCSQRCACKQRKTQCTDCLPAHLGLCKNTGLDDRVESNEEQANKEAPQASTSRPSQSSGKASQGRFGAGSHRDTSGANLLLEVESAADRSKTADDFRAAENLLNNMGEEELRQRLRNILQTQPHMMPFITNSIGPEQAEPVPGWCECGHCVFEAEQRHQICCQWHHCVTNEPTFSELCLTRSVVEIAGVANYAYRFGGVSAEYSNSKFRSQAYRFFILWMEGVMGPRVRKCPPSCVRAKIRWRFPSDDGTYTGYQSS